MGLAPESEPAIAQLSETLMRVASIGAGLTRSQVVAFQAGFLFAKANANLIVTLR